MNPKRPFIEQSIETIERAIDLTKKRLSHSKLKLSQFDVDPDVYDIAYKGELLDNIQSYENRLKTYNQELEAFNELKNNDYVG